MSVAFHGPNGLVDFPEGSNFYPCTVVYCSTIFLSSEHAYVWAKTTDQEEKLQVISTPAPGKVKRLGKKLKHLRPDWNCNKLRIMFDVVYAKFSQNKDLAAILEASGDYEITEFAPWGDNFWGVVDGVGENNLGKILMAVRSALRIWA